MFFTYNVHPFEKFINLIRLNQLINNLQNINLIENITYSKVLLIFDIELIIFV